MRLQIVLRLTVVLMSFGQLAHSQAVNATLVGTVTDSSGAVVPNAKVTVSEISTNVSRSGLTNERGNYTFPNVVPGNYSVQAQLTGFKTETRKSITVLIDTTARVYFQLQPGNVSETVEVTGAPPQLQTDSASTNQHIQNTLVENTPLGDNRNFQSLLSLVPGTAPVVFQHSQFFNAESSLQTEVNGQMREGNNFMIEGTDDNERGHALSIALERSRHVAAVLPIRSEVISVAISG